MNILLVAPKSDIKIYNTIIKTVPNANVLGMVSSIKSEFITDLKNKYHPHAVLIDTAVPSKAGVTDIIFSIKAYYPYIKVIVITDENDRIDYPPSYTVVRGQITSVQLKDIIKSTNNDSHIPEPASSSYSANAKYSFDDDGSAITEKLTVDKLSTSLKIKQPEMKYKKKHRSKKKSSNVKLIAIISAAAASIALIVMLSVFKSTQQPDTTATYDETTTVAAVINTTAATVENSSTEYISPETIPTSKIKENIDERIAYSEISESSKKTAKKSSSRSENKNNANNSSSSGNGSAANKTNNGNSTSNDTSHYITYDDSNYNNSNNNAVSSIKLSYNSKTMYEGDKLKLTATIIPSTATCHLSWVSSNTAVAKVSSDGSVVAIKPGTATITCQANNKTATCNITVISSPTLAPAKEDNVYLSRTNLRLLMTQTFTIILYNCDRASFTINNPSVADIAETTHNAVIIRAFSKGSTVLVAKNTETGKTYRCTITVE